MRNICIHTTLMSQPKCKPGKLITITRGASASFNFDLSDKVYNIDDIVQMTFIFKQGKTTYWYNMFDYFVLTEDTSILEGKNYYQITYLDEKTSNQCEAQLIAEPESNPEQAGYYELANSSADQANLPWQFDDHFYFDETEGHNRINFLLSSSETKQLNATSPRGNIQFEVVIKLNTSSLEGTHGKDLTIIEPQHPVAVIDSLYSNIADIDNKETNTSSLSIPSVTTLCSTNLLCKDYL